MATATLHVHPTCASNRSLIERLQATTGMLVVVDNGKPKLKVQAPAPTTPTGPWGGNAA